MCMAFVGFSLEIQSVRASHWGKQTHADTDFRVTGETTAEILSAHVLFLSSCVGRVALGDNRRAGKVGDVSTPHFTVLLHRAELGWCWFLYKLNRGVWHPWSRKSVDAVFQQRWLTLCLLSAPGEGAAITEVTTTSLDDPIHFTDKAAAGVERTESVWKEALRVKCYQTPPCATGGIVHETESIDVANFMLSYFK